MPSEEINERIEAALDAVGLDSTRTRETNASRAGKSNDSPSRARWR